MRILLADILTFDGFFGAKFDIPKPRWLLTAAVAVARKLSVIMHAMLKSGELFDRSAGLAA